MNYLLDTNICVYFMRGKRNVAAKISEIGQEHFFISEMTLGELLYGAQCSDRPSENIRAVHVFCQYVTILPTANIWNEFAVQKAFLRKKGQLIEDADIIIGTTAIINNMVMVTENVKHIGRLNGIVVVNWMEKKLAVGVTAHGNGMIKIPYGSDADIHFNCLISGKHKRIKY